MRILTTMAVLAAGAASLLGLYNALQHFDGTLPQNRAALLADVRPNGRDVVTTGFDPGTAEPAPLTIDPAMANRSADRRLGR